MKKLYLNIKTGEIFNEEINTLSCRICTDPEEEEASINEEYLENFWDLVKDKLPSLHFIVESEEGDNLDFLTFITHWFNRDDRVKQTQDAETRLLETRDFGNFILVNDSGFIQFRCPSFTGLQELYKFFCIFDADKHLKDE